MKCSQPFNTIIQWCRRFWSTKSLTNSGAHTSAQSRNLPVRMEIMCGGCTQTYPTPGYLLEDSPANPLTYSLCPHVRIVEGRLGKVSFVLMDGGIVVLTNPKSR